VTNTVLHTASGAAGGVFAVSLSARPGAVTVAVDDLGSAGQPVIRDGGEDLAGSGLGLVLVATLAKEWGSTRTASGWRVWAELSGADAAGAG